MIGLAARQSVTRVITCCRVLTDWLVGRSTELTWHGCLHIVNAEEWGRELWELDRMYWADRKAQLQWAHMVGTVDRSTLENGEDARHRSRGYGRKRRRDKDDNK